MKVNWTSAQVDAIENAAYETGLSAGRLIERQRIRDSIIAFYDNHDTKPDIDDLVPIIEESI